MAEHSGVPEPGSSEWKAIEAALAEHPSAESAFAALGRELGASATGEAPEEVGRETFERRLGEIRRAVCNDPRVRSYCASSDYADVTSLGGLIFGALTASAFEGLNLFLVVCICVRLGLRQLCDKVWSSEEQLAGNREPDAS